MLPLHTVHSGYHSTLTESDGFVHVSDIVSESKQYLFRTHVIIRTSFTYVKFPMSRVFAYCRVSTLEQTTENQRREIEAAGFAVKPQRLIEEHISGSVAASERPGFASLIDRMENGDVLIVTKLDRLGRNAMDIRKTVEQLAVSDIRVTAWL